MINRVQQHGVAVIQNRGSCGHGFRFLKEVLVSCEHTRHRLGGASAVRGFTARSCESPFAGLISFGPGVPEPEEDPARSVAQTVPKPACDVTRGGVQVATARKNGGAALQFRNPPSRWRGSAADDVAAEP